MSNHSIPFLHFPGHESEKAPVVFISNPYLGDSGSFSQLRDLWYPLVKLGESCAGCLRSLAMDAVQQANSGHPGTPMAMAPVAYALWARDMAFTAVSLVRWRP